MTGNVYNRLLPSNAPTARGLTCCKILVRHLAFRKSWSTKLPLGGEVNHIWLVAYGEPIDKKACITVICDGNIRGKQLQFHYFNFCCPSRWDKTLILQEYILSFKNIPLCGRFSHSGKQVGMTVAFLRKRAEKHEDVPVYLKYGFMTENKIVQKQWDWTQVKTTIASSLHTQKRQTVHV